MALCISVFERLDLQVLRNHQHYCSLFGYPHRWVETAHIAHPMLRQAYRYHLLLQELRQAADNDWVLLWIARRHRPSAGDGHLVGRARCAAGQVSPAARRANRGSSRTIGRCAIPRKTARSCNDIVLSCTNPG